MQSLNDREQLFVALGAAIGSNCVPCVESIVPKAQNAGIENWELRLAVNVADMVRQKPAAKVLSRAKALVDGEPEQDPGVGTCPLDRTDEGAIITAGEATRADQACCG